MSHLNFDYVPLTFINDQEEIKKQIRNTLILIHLFEKYNNPVRLEQLIEGTQYGYNASALQSGKNKFLRISDIHESKVIWETVPYCNCDDEKTYLLKKDDILIARTGGTTGKSFKIDNPPAHSIYAGYLIRIRAKQEVNPDYIYLFLHSFAYWSQIVNLNERNFRPKANAENLKSLILPDCSTDIQNDAVKISNGELVKGYEELYSAIEKTLTEYDKTQEVQKLLSDQLNQLENLNQAILQEAVQGKLVKQDPKDEPASELLQRIKAEKDQLIKEKKRKKQKPLPPIKPEEIPFEIPENWVWCRLGEITNYGSSPKAEPTDLKNDTWVLDLEDIEKTTSNLLCKIRFNERNSLSTKSVFKTGDVLYSKLRPYLDKVIVADEDGVCTTEILPLKCFANLNPYYLKYALKRADFLKYVNSKTKGMKMPRLGTKDGEMALIPLPPLSAQKRIVTEIEKQLVKTKQLKEHIIANQQATEQLLKALLHQAFEVEAEKGKDEREYMIEDNRELGMVAERGERYEKNNNIN
jgi:type I restriction enzyme, S subunit